MKPFVMLGVACLLMFSAEVRAQDAAAEDQYFDVYSLILKADTLANKGRTDEARSNYVKAEVALKKLKEDYPLWNTKTVRYRLDYLNTKIEATTPPAKPAMKRALSDEPIVPGNSSDPVDFKLKFRAGQGYTFTEDRSLTLKSDRLDPATLAKLNKSSTDTIVVTALKDRDGGGQEMETQQVSGKLNGRDETDDPMIGLRVRYLTDAQGKVESLENYQEVVDRLVNGANSDVEKEFLKKDLTEARVKEMVTMNDELPDHPVKVGDTWGHTSQKVLTAPTGALIVHVDSKYTFRGWAAHEGRKYAVIDYGGDYAGSSGGDADSAPGEKTSMAFNETGNVSGKIWFSPDQSMIVQENETSKYSIQPASNGNAGNAIHVADDKVVKLAANTAAQ